MIKIFHNIRCIWYYDTCVSVWLSIHFDVKSVVDQWSMVPVEFHHDYTHVQTVKIIYFLTVGCYRYMQLTTSAAHITLLILF